MQYFVKKIISASAVVLFSAAAMSAHAQTAFTACSTTQPAEAYIINQSTFYSLNLATGAMNPLGTSTPLSGNNVNAIGYGNDNFIWGWRNDTHRFVRIGQGGVADYPFPSPPVGADLTFFLGDIDPVTGYMVLANDSSIYRINTATNTVMGSIIPTTAFQKTTDFAFDATASYIYSVHASGQAFRVTWNGATGTVGPQENLVMLPEADGQGGWGAVFMDNGGDMYAYRSGNGDKKPADDYAVGLVYRIFKNGPTGPWVYTLLATAPPASNLDGARCPTSPAPLEVPATLLLRKTTTGEAGGPFTFTLTNTTTAISSVTTTAADTATQVDGNDKVVNVQSFIVSALNTDIAINETSLPVGWKLKDLTCKDRNSANVGSLAAGVFTIPASAVKTGEVFLCDAINGKVTADLAISKDNGTLTLVSGETTVYTVIVSNHGPDAANNAVIKDVVPATLTCTEQVACTATGTGTSCPTVTVSALKNAGVTVPSFGNGGVLTLKMTCLVN